MKKTIYASLNNGQSGAINAAMGNKNFMEIFNKYDNGFFVIRATVIKLIVHFSNEDLSLVNVYSPDMNCMTNTDLVFDNIKTSLERSEKLKKDLKASILFMLHGLLTGIMSAKENKYVVFQYASSLLEARSLYNEKYTSHNGMTFIDEINIRPYEKVVYDFVIIDYSNKFNEIQFTQFLESFGSNVDEYAHLGKIESNGEDDFDVVLRDYDKFIYVDYSRFKYNFNNSKVNVINDEWVQIDCGDAIFNIHEFKPNNYKKLMLVK